MKHILTETERSVLTNALYVAAERFDEHVKTMRELGLTSSIAKNLAEQFERQAKDAREMASRIEGADEVVLEGGGE